MEDREGAIVVLPEACLSHCWPSQDSGEEAACEDLQGEDSDVYTVVHCGLSIKIRRTRSASRADYQNLPVRSICPIKLDPEEWLLKFRKHHTGSALSHLELYPGELPRRDLFYLCSNYSSKW